MINKLENREKCDETDNILADIIVEYCKIIIDLDKDIDIVTKQIDNLIKCVFDKMIENEKFKNIKTNRWIQFGTKKFYESVENGDISFLDCSIEFFIEFFKHYLLN